MPYQAFKILDITWTQMKTYKTRDTFTLYYVAGASSKYEVIGISSKFVYRTYLITASEVTDFTTNFLSAAIATPSIDDAIGAANLFETNQSVLTSTINGNITSTPTSTGIGLDVNILNSPTVAAVDAVWIETRLSTANQAINTLFTYTVPAGKTFYLMQFSLGRVSVNNTNCEATFEVVAVGGGSFVELDAVGFNAASSTSWTVSMYIGAVAIATAGQQVRLRFTPSSSTNTSWAGKLIGISR